MMRNPIFESSMKRRMRSFRSPLLLTLYGLFLLLVSLGALRILQSDQITLGNMRTGIETYIYISVMQFVLILLVSPALTAGSIAGERERQTLDLLLCTRLGALRIALGKLFSSLSFLVLMILSSLPMMGVVFLFGGISLMQVLSMLLLLVVTAFACCSIGIFCSAVFKRTVTATVVAYLSIFALGAGTVILPLMLQYRQLSMLLNASDILPYLSDWQLFQYMPKLLYLNPALGLLSMLVEQTGILERTFGSMGGSGYTLYRLFDKSGSTAMINMIVLTGCGVLLTLLSALWIKPLGRKAHKRAKG